jgi:hypothetical protein
MQPTGGLGRRRSHTSDFCTRCRRCSPRCHISTGTLPRNQSPLLRRPACRLCTTPGDTPRPRSFAIDSRRRRHRMHPRQRPPRPDRPRERPRRRRRPHRPAGQTSRFPNTPPPQTAHWRSRRYATAVFLASRQMFAARPAPPGGGETAASAPRAGPESPVESHQIVKLSSFKNLRGTASKALHQETAAGHIRKQ